MTSWLGRFRKAEDGAITVDWVVLAAAIIGLSIGLLTLIASAATDKSEGVGARLENHMIPTYN